MKKKLKKNKLWVGMLIGAVLLGGLVTYGVQAKAQVGGFSLDRLLDVFDRHVELEREDAVGEVIVIEESFGALSSPNLGSYYVVGGNTFRGSRKDNLNTATTTFCAIQSPVGTSTLVSAEIYLDTSSTTGMTLEIAKGEAQSITGGTPNATTTLINSFAIAANAKVLIIASTTSISTNDELDAINFSALVKNVATTTDDDTNDWLIFRAYTNVAAQVGEGTFSPIGHCQAVFREN